jgi:hypothetical protein
MEEMKLSSFVVVVEDLVQEEETGQYFWQPEKIDINPDDDLLVDDSNVDSELVKMGHLLGYYGDISARLKAQLARKEEDKEAVDAEIDKEIRDRYVLTARTGKEKPPTESKIKKEIIRHEKYQGALAILSATRLYYYRMDTLLKALIKKADAVNTLAYSQRAERKNY